MAFVIRPRAKVRRETYFPKAANRLPSSPTLLLALEAAPSGLGRSQYQEKGDSFLVRAARGFYVLLPHGGRSVPARQVHLGNKKVAKLARRMSDHARKVRFMVKKGGKMDGWTKVHRGRFLLSPEVYSTYSKSYPNITLGLSNLDGIKNWQNRLW